jgi:PAS domain S-box-containing protein
MIGVRSDKYDFIKKLATINQQSENSVKTILESAPDGVYLSNLKGIFLYGNKKAEEITGYTREELLGKSFLTLKLLSPKYLAKALGLLAICALGRATGPDEFELITKDGNRTWVEISTAPIRHDGQGSVIGFVRDISARKLSEDQTRSLKEHLQIQIDRMPIALIDWDTDFRVRSWNPAAEKMFGFSEKEALGKHAYDFIVSKDTQPTIDDIWGRLLRGDTTASITNENLTKEGHIIICKWSNTPLSSKNHAIVGVLSMVEDITDRRRAEENLRQSYVKLQNTLDSFISAMTATMGKRDPYTSGHQYRVAQLARAITIEQGFSEEKAKALYTAGLMHDIGKIGIPSDILSKPGKLNEIEYDLIKTHSQIGYDVLQKFDFQFPLAEWVLQHHERLNGSGYPGGLNNDEISLEAKILAVADVVESRISHHPYRPASSIETTLNEIESQSGILYDPAAVSACVRLFKEKHFELNKSEMDNQ